MKSAKWVAAMTYCGLIIAAYYIGALVTELTTTGHGAARSGWWPMYIGMQMLLSIPALTFTLIPNTPRAFTIAAVLFLIPCGFMGLMTASPLGLVLVFSFTYALPALLKWRVIKQYKSGATAEISPLFPVVGLPLYGFLSYAWGYILERFVL